MLVRIINPEANIAAVKITSIRKFFMQARPNTNLHLTTIEFSMGDQSQYRVNSAFVSSLIEAYSPALGLAVAHELNAMTRKITTNIFRNATLSAFGFKVQIELLTPQPFSQSEENVETVQGAIKKCIPFIFNPLLFNLETSSSRKITITTEQTAIADAKYRGKVEKRNYEYNGANATEKLEVQFIDENIQPVMGGANEKKMKYDRWGNITEIAYTYAEYTPNPSQLARLEEEVTAYVKQHTNCTPFLISIKAMDFNQAFRRACTAGNIVLVKLLLRYDSECQLNLDINQQSANGKTALDYAIASDNSELIEFLKTRKAVESKNLRYSLVNDDREKIIALNPPIHRTGDNFYPSNYTLPFADTRTPSQRDMPSLSNQGAQTGIRNRIFPEDSIIGRSLQNFSSRMQQMNAPFHSSPHGVFGGYNNPTQARPASSFNQNSSVVDDSSDNARKYFGK